LKRNLQLMRDTMTADYLSPAGADGKAIIDAYHKK
jgi:hypothetical protein